MKDTDESSELRSQLAVMTADRNRLQEELTSALGRSWWLPFVRKRSPLRATREALARAEAERDEALEVVGMIAAMAASVPAPVQRRDAA